MLTFCHNYNFLWHNYGLPKHDGAMGFHTFWPFVCESEYTKSAVKVKIFQFFVMDTLK